MEEKDRGAISEYANSKSAYWVGEFSGSRARGRAYEASLRVGCGHRSSALSLRPLLRGTCPCIVAYEHICRHYLSPNSHSMRFGRRHFSRLILASSFRCSFSGLPLWLVRLSIGPLIGLLWDRLWARPCSSGFPPALYLGSSDWGAVPA
jgi:hypothetical protein